MDEQQIKQAAANPQNVGEMTDADAVGTVGSPDCGDMVRLWIKYKDQGGQKVIDKASFQSFGCQTAIAVASMATQMILGKTREEALKMDAGELSKPLGPLPPMKIHCGQMVEGALKAALEAEAADKASVTQQVPAVLVDSSLHDALASAGKSVGKIKIVPLGS
jgi:nitrogen fixation NifU-like protein